MAFSSTCFVTAAWAQGEADTPPAPSGPTTTTHVSPTFLPSAEAQEEARQRFMRALELADDGQFDAALVELNKAYELAPTYRILYNVGVVYQQLKDYARALDAYELYIEEGGAGIDEDRLKDVNARIERLNGRVGYLEVRTSEPGAEVTVDDRLVGKTPLRPVRVNSGQRKVTVHLPGRPAQTRVLDLAGGETKVASFDVTLAPISVVARQEPPKSIVPWVSWGATLALAGGALATGVVASNHIDDYDRLDGQFSPDRKAMTSAQDSAHTFGLVSDILWGAAIVGAGVSTYFTIKPPKVDQERSPATPPTQVGLYSTGAGGGLRVRF
jgi:hypothetical protein